MSRGRNVTEKKTPRLTNSRRPEDLSRSGLRLSSLNLDSPSLVDSSGAWDLTHSALLTNLFPYSLHSSTLFTAVFLPFPTLVSSYSLHFPTLFNYLLFITYLISTVFTSLLSSHLCSLHIFFSLTSLLSSHLYILTSYYCLIIVLCLILCVCVVRFSVQPLPAAHGGTLRSWWHGASHACVGGRPPSQTTVLIGD